MADQHPLRAPSDDLAEEALSHISTADKAMGTVRATLNAMVRSSDPAIRNNALDMLAALKKAEQSLNNASRKVRDLGDVAAMPHLKAAS